MIKWRKFLVKMGAISSSDSPLCTLSIKTTHRQPWWSRAIWFADHKFTFLICFFKLPYNQTGEVIVLIDIPRAMATFREQSSLLICFTISRLRVVSSLAKTMPPRRSLDTSQRMRAIAWVESGLSVREVARRLAVSHSTIQRILERFQATGSVEDRHRPGRPRCTNRHDDRYLLLSALRHRTVTCSTLRCQLRQTVNVNVSQSTIRRRLHEFGLAARRPAVRIPLTPAHRRARVAWCREHIRWTRQQWSQVLFTDESRFTVSFNDGRIRVWRRPGERFTDDTIREVDRYGRGSVMVWGGFYRHGRTPLYIIQGNLTGPRYQNEILRPIVQPTLEAIGGNAILQDDNARPHRARVVNEFIQQHGIIRMAWPAHSPDLSPIEHLWDVLGRRLSTNHPLPMDVAQLTAFLLQEWQAVPQDTLRTLVDSMRLRCLECLAANGGHTRFWNVYLSNIYCVTFEKVGDTLHSFIAFECVFPFLYVTCQFGIQ